LPRRSGYRSPSPARKGRRCQAPGQPSTPQRLRATARDDRPVSPQSVWAARFKQE
jgi:hypothetical protein